MLLCAVLYKSCRGTIGHSGTYGLTMPITILNNGEVSLIGGYSQYGHSIEQHLKLDDLSVLRTVGVSDSVFQGLIAANGESKRVKFAKIYLNV